MSAAAHQGLCNFAFLRNCEKLFSAMNPSLATDSNTDWHIFIFLMPPELKMFWSPSLYITLTYIGSPLDQSVICWAFKVTMALNQGLTTGCHRCCHRNVPMVTWLPFANSTASFWQVKSLGKPAGSCKRDCRHNCRTLQLNGIHLVLTTGTATTAVINQQSNALYDWVT